MYVNIYIGEPTRVYHDKSKHHTTDPKEILLADSRYSQQTGLQTATSDRGNQDRQEARHQQTPSPSEDQRPREHKQEGVLQSRRNDQSTPLDRCQESGQLPRQLGSFNRPIFFSLFNASKEVSAHG